VSAALDSPPIERVAPVESPRSPVPLPRAPRPERPAKQRHTRRRVVRTALLLVGLLAGWLLFDSVLGPLIHEQRQHHLAAQYERPLPKIGDGNAVAVLQVPTLGINQVVVEGASVAHLRSGPTHWTGSALPGDAGVMVVLGHRDAYGGPFRKLSTMKNGDSIVVQARNGGPIVRYVVDRVERHLTLEAVALPQTDVVSYLLLATSEDGMFTGDQTIVVARALPVTDTGPVLPDLSANLRPAPFGLEALLALASMAIAVLALSYLRVRSSVLVRVVVVAPPAAYAALQLLMSLDSILALTR